MRIGHLASGTLTAMLVSATMASSASANTHANTCFISNDWADKETQESMSLVENTVGTIGTLIQNNPSVKWGNCKNSKAVTTAMNHWINSNNCKSVHVITHGGGGKLQLPCTPSGNNSTISTASMITYQADSSIGGDPLVDFYVYSCGCKKPTPATANNKLCVDAVIHPATNPGGEPAFISYASSGDTDAFAVKSTLYDWPQGYGGYLEYMLGDVGQRTAQKDVTFWTWASDAWTSTAVAAFRFEPFAFND